MEKKTNPLKTFICSAALLFSLTACSTTDDIYNEAGIHDPFEKTNRAVFAFNEGLDNAIVEPVAKGYRAVTPQFFRTGVGNFLRNLKSPVNIANQILQGDVEGAASDVTRALVNTTIGIGGFVDVAESAGLPYEEEDFGQTLAVWGVDHGPYLVVPVMGPSSVRDSVGDIVDIAADPLRIYLDNIDEEEWLYARVGATVISRREEFIDILDDLEQNSIDYYATMRSIYVQRRHALVNDLDTETSIAPAIPDYDDEDYSDLEALMGYDEYSSSAWSLDEVKNQVVLYDEEAQDIKPRKFAMEAAPDYQFTE